MTSLPMNQRPTINATPKVSITSAFTLAKMLRDRYDADLFEARVQGRRDAQMQQSSAVASEDSIVVK